MVARKLFNCQKCDAAMEVESPRNQDQVVCRRCGRLYRLLFDEQEQAWFLQAEEPVEPDEEDRRREDEPFTVLDEVGRPKRVDRSEQHREQSDVHAGEDIAIDKEHKPS